jgi:hypothetical protein
MLFRKVLNRVHKSVKSPYGQRVQRQVIVIEQARDRAGFMRRLELLCHNSDAHPLPVKMKFIAETMSDKGLPMWVYGCCFRGCRHREGYVQERYSGKPYRLWAGLYDGR